MCFLISVYTALTVDEKAAWFRQICNRRVEPLQSGVTLIKLLFCIFRDLSVN